MKRVVLMTDFSDNARNAIEYGVRMFGSAAEYILIHTYTVRSSTGSFGNLADIMRQDAVKDLESELQLIKAKYFSLSDARIKSVCSHGDPVDVLNEVNKKEPVDIVIMGTKGASGLSKMIMGSVTSSVIKNTKLPVLSVPEKAEFKGIKRIVFAADLEENRTEKLTYPLKSIATKNQSDLILLHILKEGQLAGGYDQDKLEKLKMTIDIDDSKKALHMVEAKDTIKGIESFCVDNNVDLLTVIARHNTFFSQLFHKSVSQELAFSLKMPLLTLEDSF